MGQVEPMLPEDELDGMLREAVNHVRRDPVSEQLIERCASRAMEIPRSGGVRPTDKELDRGTTTETSHFWSWPEGMSLAASLLVALSLNALSIALGRPDPNRQKVAQLTTTDKEIYCIYSDLRLESCSDISASH